MSNKQEYEQEIRLRALQEAQMAYRDAVTPNSPPVGAEEVIARAQKYAAFLLGTDAD